MTWNVNKRSVPPNDNARIHSAQATQALLRQVGWEVLAHSPRSPALAPNDYYLFIRLKKTFGGGKRFKNDKVFQQFTNPWLREVTRDDYEVCVQKLIPQYRKSIELNKNYVKNDD